MKVHQAVIRLYLKTSKVLSDGSSPILLRVSFNGFKEVSTHYSCDARHSFAQNYIEKGGNILSLCTFLANTISTYVKNLTLDEKLIDVIMDD